MKKITERDQQYHLLNEDELQRFLSDHAGMDGLELQHGLFQTATEQLRQMVNRRTEPNPRPQTPNPLARFAGLHPTEEQIRQALLSLMEMPHPDGKGRKLIYHKSHWLAVMRALQFLGVISTKYGCRQEFAHYANSVYYGGKGCFKAKYLKDIELESPFHRPLTDWYRHLENPRVKYYWEIAILFFDCICREIPKTLPKTSPDTENLTENLRGIFATPRIPSIFADETRTKLDV